MTVVHAPSTPTLSVRPVVLPAPERGDDLQVRVTAPATGDHLPVVVFAHGFGASMTWYDPLVDHWSEHGFVVVQPTFLDSEDYGLTPADPRYGDIWRWRVSDLERVIDQLDVVLQALPGLGERVDAARLAAVGHSWGGQSVGMLLGARVIGSDGQPAEDRTDPRVRAGVLLSTTGVAGDELTPFARENFAFMSPDFDRLTTPTLVVAGDHDQSLLSTRGPDWFTDVYHRSPGAQALLTVFGAEHSLGGIYGYHSSETTDENPSAVDLVARVSTAFLSDALGVDGAAWPTPTDDAGRLDTK